MFRFALGLIKPYRTWLVIVVLAMLIETLMSLASPWPIKIVLDSVLDARAAPGWVAWLLGAEPGRLAILKAAVVATVAIALAQGAGSYLDSYYSSNIGQWIGHDLRQTMYAHLQRLSMSYYDRQQVGPLISTMTDDINAVQDFISTSLLKILVDLLTIVGMLAVMLTLNLNFTLVALTVTPLLGLFVYRLRYVVKLATHDVRRRQGEMVTIVQEGLGAIRLVKAFAQGSFERQRLDEKSLQSVQAALQARRARSLVGPVVTLLVAIGTAAVLWFGTKNCKQNPAYDPLQPNDPRNWNAVNTVVTPSWFSDYVLTVGAVDTNGQPLTQGGGQGSMSIAGPWVSMAAPGTDVIGLSPRDDGLINAIDGPDNSLLIPAGTSFSTAIVSGVAALVRAKFPQLTAYQIINRLVRTARPPARGVDNQVGYGVVDPVAALTWDVPEGPAKPQQQLSAPLNLPKSVAHRDMVPVWVAVGGFTAALLIGGAAFGVAMMVARTRKQKAEQ